MRKDDVVYYKKKLTDLLKDAQKNGIIIKEFHGTVIFKREFEVLGHKDYEQTTVCIKDFIKQSTQ